MKKTIIVLTLGLLSSAAFAQDYWGYQIDVDIDVHYGEDAAQVADLYIQSRRPAAVLATGCGGAGTTPADRVSPLFDLPSGTTVELIADRSTVDSLVMHDLSGTSWSMDDLRGKVVLVNFWATWCSPCRYEIPDLIKIQDRYGDHVQVIGVSLDEGGADIVNAFADELQMNYPVVMDSPTAM